MGRITKDGEFVTNRSRHGRHKDARLRFNPKLLFSINWATSGPGFEWPEAYYVTYVLAWKNTSSLRAETAMTRGAAQTMQSAQLIRLMASRKQQGRY
jgi:hypothetical protein